jgi:hypothetical protein
VSGGPFLWDGAGNWDSWSGSPPWVTQALLAGDTSVTLTAWMLVGSEEVITQGYAVFGGGVLGWGHELTLPGGEDGSPVKVGLLSNQIVNCVVPPIFGDISNTPAVVLFSDGNVWIYTPPSGADCWNGTWEQSGVARDIADDGTVFVGSDGKNIFNTSDNTCKFEGPVSPSFRLSAVTQAGTNGCVSAIDTSGHVWQENKTCGI